MKKQLSITLDKEITEWIKSKCKGEHLDFSTMLNQILWKIKRNNNL